MTGEGTIRVDQWLWQARFFKTRAMASRLCTARRVRVDGRVIAKAHHALRVGDVLTFPQERRIRVVRVVALGARRGPAPEAATLYEDMSPDDPVDRGERSRRPRPWGLRLPGSRMPW